MTSGQIVNLSDMAGIHTLEISALDKAGNSNNAAVTFQVIIAATVDIDPDTLNLSSNGNWVTVFIELAGGAKVNTIDGSTVMLNGVVPAYLGKQGWAKAESNGGNLSDHDGDGIPERMIKFEMEAVKDILEVGDKVIITITGQAGDAPFEGTDIIRVIDEGSKGNSEGKGKK